MIYWVLVVSFQLIKCYNLKIGHITALIFGSWHYNNFLFDKKCTYVENSKENEEGVHDQSHYVAEGGKCEGHLRSLFLRMNVERERNKFIRKLLSIFHFSKICVSQQLVYIMTPLIK